MTKEIIDIGNGQSELCYPGTDVLINKKNIKDEKELEKAERVLTAYKLALLASGDYSSIKQTWDYDHYMSINKFLFDELYDFAGKERKEDTAKSFYFCRSKFIYDKLTEKLDRMEYGYTKVKNRNLLIIFLSEFFVSLNNIHPFREGNGRTLREFLREYVERINEANNLNYELDYKLITDDLKQKYLYASINGDVALMKEVFDSIVIEKELNHEKGIHK